MSALLILLNVAAAAAVTTAPQGGQLLQAARENDGMPPCKRCSAARLPSRDDLLARDDGDLNRMKDDLTKEVDDLEDEVKDIKKNNDAELGKLKKRLADMNDAYTKAGKDAVDRTAKFTTLKAKANKDLVGALDDTEKKHAEIAKLHDSMDEMRKYLNPYVDKIISGKGWPKGCKCPGAKALLQRLQAKLQLANVALDDSEPVRRGEALLRKSSKTGKPADQEKYKLVREVQQLAEKKAKLTQEKTAAITGFSEEQRRALDRINVAKTKANLKANAERNYKENDEDLEKKLKDQTDAAKSYLDSATSQLDRLKKNEGDSLKDFKSFKAELQKCKCI